jgi:hypothetical protein
MANERATPEALGAFMREYPAAALDDEASLYQGLWRAFQRGWALASRPPSEPPTAEQIIEHAGNCCRVEVIEGEEWVFDRGSLLAFVDAIAAKGAKTAHVVPIKKTA